MAQEIFRKIKRRLFARLKPADDFPPPWKAFDASPVDSANRLKVLVLSNWFPHPAQPGLGSFVMEQVKALREFGGIDARVLAGRPFWFRSKNLFRMWNGGRAYKEYAARSRWWDLQGVPVKYAPYPIIGGFWSHGWTYRKAMLREAVKMREKFPFDFVHAHTGYMDGSAGLAIAKQFNIPLIITEHTGPFSALASNPLVKRMTVNALNGAEKVIAVSEAQKRIVGAYLRPERRNNIKVIPNGVDTTTFYPAARQSSQSESPRILFVGYFEASKNIPLLIEAFALVKQSLPKARLTLIGGGEISEEMKIKDLICRMKLEQSVAITGYKPRAEVARLMREKCDMLALSSRAETFGCVLIEALASGRPVAATRCGGPSDIVIEPFLGELCVSEDASALANAILTVARRLPEYDSAEIRKYAVERFSYQTVAKLICKEYALLTHPKQNFTTETQRTQSYENVI